MKKFSNSCQKAYQVQLPEYSWDVNFSLIIAELVCRRKSITLGGMGRCLREFLLLERYRVKLELAEPFLCWVPSPALFQGAREQPAASTSSLGSGTHCRPHHSEAAPLLPWIESWVTLRCLVPGCFTTNRPGSPTAEDSLCLLLTGWTWIGPSEPVFSSRKWRFELCGLSLPASSQIFLSWLKENTAVELKDVISVVGDERHRAGRWGGIYTERTWLFLSFFLLFCFLFLKTQYMMISLPLVLVMLFFFPLF